MKSRFLLLASAVMLAASCQMTEMELTPSAPPEQAAPETKEMIITASVESTSPSTRTETERVDITSTKAEFPTYWLPGDKIMLFSAGDASEFTSLNTDRAKVAQFKGTISAITGAEGEEKSYVWGVYPSQGFNLEYTEPDGKSETAVIYATYPSIQEGKVGSFSNGVAMMIGRSETTGISFKNVYSAFSFTFTRSDIISITLSGCNNEKIAGRFGVTLVNGEPKSTVVAGEGIGEVTLYAPNGSAFEAGKEYFLLFLPTTFTAGQAFTLKTAGGEEGTYIHNKGTAVERKRNAFTRLKTIDDRVSNADNIASGVSTGWHAATTQAVNEIWYTTTDREAVTYVVPSYSDTGNEVDEANCVAPVDNGGVGIIRFKGPLTKIDNDAFYNSWGAKLKSVSFPDCVETIGNSAFDGCENLSEVHFGTGLKVIGEWAFSYTNLSEIILPDGLELIGNSAFNHTQLTSVHIPESVVHLSNMSLYGLDIFGGNPFWQCYNLQSFTGKFATDDGRALIETAPDGKKVFVSFAPAGMDNETYTIPAVDVIGTWAFTECTLGQVVLPTGLKIISDYAFWNCKNLTSLDIPASVNEICGGAFRGCSKLKFVRVRAIVIPSMVSSAPFTYASNENTFADCHEDLKIYVPSQRLKYYKNGEHWDDYEDRIEGYVRFVDSAFESYMVDSSNGFDIDGNGIISTDETERITKIEYDASRYGSLIQPFGIQYFPNLEKFSLDNGGADCQLLYLKYATGLKYLTLSNCGAYNINALTNLTELISLEITACTRFTSLNLTYNNKLVFLRVAGMPALTQLNLAPSESMSQLLCYNNALESINVSGFPNLTQLTCFGNNITELDVSSNADLQKLYCKPNNALQTIYVSSMAQVKTDWEKPITANYVVKE